MGEQGSEPQIEVGLETKKRKRYRKREDGRTRLRATDRGWVRNKKERQTDRHKERGASLIEGMSFVLIWQKAAFFKRLKKISNKS